MPILYSLIVTEVRTMLDKLISIFLSIFQFFQSLSPETKAKLYNLVADLFEEFLRVMYKSKKNGNHNGQD